MSLPLESARVVVQGFGNVGSHTARCLAEMGAKVIALSDVHGGVRCDEGIDVAAALAYAQREGRLKGLPGTRAVDNEEFVTLPCDVLIPAALDGSITCDNAEEIRAKLVVEAANMPVTHMADQTLRGRGVAIVPDVLANAGGVIASYCEWAQNIQQLPWEREMLLDRVEQHLSRTYAEVNERSASQGVDLRTAAYELAVDRVLRAIELRGF
jgi:glutamate dehydrogenase/leucine dehydrogenase